MTAAFNFERDILEECGQKNLSRIIRAIGAGKVHLDPQLPETLAWIPIGPVALTAFDQ